MFSKLLKLLGNQFQDRPGADVSIQKRKWRLLQIEPALCCNLRCVMCPWKGHRKRLGGNGLMEELIWQGIVPFLKDVRFVDFTGGGEPLRNPRLPIWLDQAKKNGCNTGLLTNATLLTHSMSERLVASHIDWIGFSIDGADQQSFEQIRGDAKFDIVTEQISYFTSIRDFSKTQTMLNFVIMKSNLHQLEAIIECAEQLGIDQVNFKQCDVIRDTHGAGLGVFESCESKRSTALKKRLTKAEKKARSKQITTNSFRFTPEEQPVCDQDPRDSLFIRYDGVVAPCINLAYGGHSEFLGNRTIMPESHYGSLKDEAIDELWETDRCRLYRTTFEAREHAYESALKSADMGRDLISFKRALETARSAMAKPPQGCARCHYLYGI